MATSLKNIKIVARYAHKTNGKFNGMVTYAVRSSNGEVIYCTTLVDGKATGCSCPAHSKCYHKTQLEAIELKRTEKWNAYKATLAKQLARQYVSTSVVAEQAMMQAALTKQGFRLMR